MNVKFTGEPILPGCTDRDYAGSLFSEKEEMRTAAERAANGMRVSTKAIIAENAKAKGGAVAKPVAPIHTR